MIRLGEQPYVTSSYTNNNGACIEVGSDRPTAVNVTDSKFNHSETARTGKPVMALSPTAFTALVDFARSAQV